MQYEVGHEIQENDPEPPRNLALKDDDGDTWTWDVRNGEEGWNWEGPNGRGIRSRSWGDVEAAFTFPMTVIGKVTITDDGRNRTTTITDPGAFVVKDSGQREVYANGFVRDTEDGKPDLTAVLALLYREPALVDVITRPGFDLLPKTALIRWADHMEKGAQKYGRNNWTQARGPIATARFCRSLVRHVAQYITGDRAEDHAAAICFNVWAAEMTPNEGVTDE